MTNTRITMSQNRLASRHGLTCRILYLTVALLATWVLLPAALDAADSKSSKESGPPEPVDIERTTPDGVLLAMRYFPGSEGENSIPIVIIHDWEEEGADYEEVALYLQSKGYAVVVPDLRGHGDSNRGKTRSRDGKENITQLTPLKVNKQKIHQDLETVRSLLVEQNNEQKLNLHKLCLIGVGDGAVFAMNHAARDWNPAMERRQLIERGGGKDVRALVLISPTIKAGPLSIETLLNNPRARGEISMLIVVGDEKQALRNAKHIYHRLKSSHTVDSEDSSKTSLFLKQKETSLQGHKLLTEPELNTQAMVNAFIELRLREANSISWEERNLTN
jgi:alpha-beta hydrolase superfamily lysophospholipase